jgi:hypothetical protein
MKRGGPVGAVARNLLPGRQTMERYAEIILRIISISGSIIAAREQSSNLDPRKWRIARTYANSRARDRHRKGNIKFSHAD